MKIRRVEQNARRSRVHPHLPSPSMPTCGASLPAARFVDVIRGMTRNVIWKNWDVVSYLLRTSPTLPVIRTSSHSSGCSYVRDSSRSTTLFRYLVDASVMRRRRPLQASSAVHLPTSSLRRVAPPMKRSRVTSRQYLTAFQNATV